MHRPLPWHAGAGVAKPLEQKGAPQTVDLPGKAHAAGFVPSQTPPHAPEPAHAARPPLGMPVTVTHWPILPTWSHAWH